MTSGDPRILKLLSWKRTLFPILIGFGVVLYFILKDFDVEVYRKIGWSWNATFWIFMALFMMAVRHFAYMYRIKMLTGNVLSWGKSFDVILLWEFASAVTPSIVGGSALALFLLNREKINMGKTTTVVLFTAFLDELFFIIFAPIFFSLASKRFMFPDNPECLTEVNISFLQTLNDLIYVFSFGYLALFLYTLLIGYGLFINPNGVKRLIIRIFSLRLLKRWRLQAWQTGSDLIVASKELQRKKIGFWLKAFGATTISWSARYLIVNCIILAVTLVDNNFIVFARQFVIWIIILIPTTPGSSGIAEITFLAVLCEFIPQGLSASLAFLWRILTYYPYVLVGIIVLPRWLKRVYSEHNS